MTRGMVDGGMGLGARGVGCGSGGRWVGGLAWPRVVRFFFFLFSGDSQGAIRVFGFALLRVDGCSGCGRFFEIVRGFYHGGLSGSEWFDYV